MSRKVLLMAEVAERYRIPLDTLRFWRHAGKGPPSFRLGRRVVYYEDEVERWVEKQARASA